MINFTQQFSIRIRQALPLCATLAVFLMLTPAVGQIAASAPDAEELTRIVSVLQFEQRMGFIQALGADDVHFGFSSDDTFDYGPWQIVGVRDSLFLSLPTGQTGDLIRLEVLRMQCPTCAKFMTTAGFKEILNAPTDLIVSVALKNEHFARLLQRLEAFTAKAQGRISL
jgi:hypothetical protein